MSANLHETLARGQALLEAMDNTHIIICGAGALGANLCEALARAGFTKLTVIDDDRVEEHNLSTQPYWRSDIGQQKAKTLAKSLYRALGTPVRGVAQRLTEESAPKLLAEAQIVVDCFDNTTSRAAVKDFCLAQNITCLHAGMADGYGEVIWNERYRVPEVTDAEDLCDYPLARNLVSLTVSICAEVLMSFLEDGRQRDYSVTLGDLAVRPLEL